MSPSNPLSGLATTTYSTVTEILGGVADYPISAYHVIRENKTDLSVV